MRARTPAVSVLIPSYNAARYLAESLDSIVAQADDDTEVIVVDDGSTDETPTVLARYEGWIRVVAGKHAGLSAARNLCLEHARGRWIAFHDADDVALPDRLAFQREFLRQHADADAVFCNGERMGGGIDRHDRVVPHAIGRRSGERVLTAQDIFGGFPVYFQGALVSRAAFRAAGPFDLALPVQPDIDYGYRLVSRFRCWFVDRVVFRYRSHGGNMSSDRLGTRDDIAAILERLLREDEAARDAIGVRRLRARLARHYQAIARQRRSLGDRERAGAAVARAAALRPFNLRYQLLRWWHAR